MNRPSSIGYLALALLSTAGCGGANVAGSDDPEIASVEQPLLAACNEDADCAAGSVCGVQNAQYFQDGRGSVCWPSSCQSLSYECGHCGTTTSVCGECPPVSECDPDTRLLKVRYFNLVANDGSGKSTGNTAAQYQTYTDAPGTAYAFPTTNETFARCPVGTRVQLSYESTRTISVPLSCFNTPCSAQEAAGVAAANSGAFLNAIVKNMPANGIANTFSSTGIRPQYMVFGSGPFQSPINQTFAHEVGHILQTGWGNPNLDSGDHFPDASTFCNSTDVNQQNLMCSSNRGYKLLDDQCRYMHDNTIIPPYLLEGSTQGDYVIAEISEEGAPPGQYTFSVASPTDGWVRLLKDGVEVSRIWYSWQTTVTTTSRAYFEFPDYLTLHVRAKVGSLNLYNLNKTIFDGRRILRVENSTGTQIRVGRSYSAYVLSNVSLKNTPAGKYTFSVASPTAGVVTLKKNGTAVATVNYSWQTTVTDTAPYTFTFPGYFTLSVRAKKGSLNLYDMPFGVFDGKRVLEL